MNQQERFDYAKTYRIGFGTYKGWELNQIAADEDEDGKPVGLCYLGWLKQQDWLNDTSRTALTNFTSHPQVEIDLNAAMERDAIQRENEPQRKGKY